MPDPITYHEVAIRMPETVRMPAIDIMLVTISTIEDLTAKVFNAHHNVKGPDFPSLHKFFEEVYGALPGFVDPLSERVVQYGGTVDHQARAVLSRTILPEIPAQETFTGPDWVKALLPQFATLGQHLADSIEALEGLKDPVTANQYQEYLFTVVDHYLMFLQAMSW